MTFTYLIGWASLAVLSAPEVTVQADESDTAAPPVLVTGSVHLGAGSLDGDAAVLLRPRFAWQTDHLSVALSAPVWLEPPSSVRQPVEWIADWSAPRVWAGVVERLEAHLFDERLVLHAGALAQETLGYGALVDRFHNQRDPLQPRLGLRAEAGGERFVVTALADDLTRPAVLATRVAVAPLALANRDPEVRWWTALELATDLYAPQQRGRAPFVAVDLDSSYALIRAATGELGVYAALVVDSRAARGAHLGTQLRADAGRRGGLWLRAELVAGSAGFTPGYFDEVYVWERIGLVGSAVPKAMQHRRSAVGFRTSADVELGVARFGVAIAMPDPRAPAAVTAYLRLDGEQLTAAFYVTERRVSEASDLVALRPSTHATVEVAYAFYQGLSVFSQVRHGPRPGAAGLASAVDWVFGLGYGAKNGQTPG